MECPDCNGKLKHLRVYRECERAYAPGDITRLRECGQCGKRYITKQPEEQIVGPVKIPPKSA